MFRRIALAAAIGAALAAPVRGAAADDAEVQKIRDEIRELKEGYESRIHQLEQRLDQLEHEPAAAAHRRPRRLPGPRWRMPSTPPCR